MDGKSRPPLASCRSSLYRLEGTGTKRFIIIIALVLLVLLAARAVPSSQTRADQPGPSGWIDVTVWQAQSDGSEQPLADANLLLSDPNGGQVAAVMTDDGGGARIDAPPGYYSLIVYRDGYRAVGKIRCGDRVWDASANIQWGVESAISDQPLSLTAQTGLCRQYLFEAIPPPAPAPAAPAALATPVGPNVYLTFDDGYVDLCQTVDLVNALGIHATFFLTGQAILAQPDCVRQLVATGNRLANHTYAHEDLTTLSRSQIITTLQRTEDAAEAVAGVSTQPLCRPPYGAINAFVRQVAADWGCTMVLWDRDTNDWAGASPSYIMSQALSVRCNGEIVLMHTQGFPNEQIALPQIVAQLQAEDCQPALLPG